ncbi:DUF3558 family protein [Nocardia harenae]|uniref:DUF3558 family protein n=1 Tax=Nocardia harenae TaxID=358707 RepID=UPI0008301F76|nr:DUF3558 family protein [Nocardia harenae]
MRRWSTLFLAFTVGPLLAGCETPSEGAGTPTPVALFDPCTLPDSAIAAAGADPAQREDNPFGAPRTGWRGCLWGADGYALRVFATDKTLAEFRDNSRFHDFRPADLPGRDATLFVQGAASEAKNCNLVYDTAQGTIQIFVIDDQLGDSFPEPCGLVTRAARAVDQWIPR